MNYDAAVNSSRYRLPLRLRRLDVNQSDIPNDDRSHMRQKRHSRKISLAELGPALVITVMLVAIFSVHSGHGFFVTKNGAELPLTYISGSLLLMFSGPGAYSLDGLLGLSLAWSINVLWTILGVAILVALANLVVRRPVRQPASEALTKTTT